MASGKLCRDLIKIKQYYPDMFRVFAAYEKLGKNLTRPEYEKLIVTTITRDVRPEMEKYLSKGKISKACIRPTSDSERYPYTRYGDWEKYGRAHDFD